MSEKFITAGVTILTAIVGVAALAVIVSRTANTQAVVTQGASSFQQMLCTALSPLGVSCAAFGGLTPIVNSTISYPGL